MPEQGGDLPAQAPPTPRPRPAPRPAHHHSPPPQRSGLGPDRFPGVSVEGGEYSPQVPDAALREARLEGALSRRGQQAALTVGPGGELDRLGAARAMSTPLFPSYVGARDTEGTDSHRLSCDGGAGPWAGQGRRLLGGGTQAKGGPVSALRFRVPEAPSSGSGAGRAGQGPRHPLGQ